MWGERELASQSSRLATLMSQEELGRAAQLAIPFAYLRQLLRLKV